MVRAEGITERMGDIVLQCSGSNPGAVLTGNLSAFLPVSVTNRVDSRNLTTDAVLAADTGNGFVSTGVPGLVSGNQITFNGFSVTVPASGSFNLKISNIRADVYQGTLLQPITAQLAFSTPAGITVDQSQPIVAFPQLSLYATLYDTGISCTGSPLPSTFSQSSFFAAGTFLASARITEGFGTAFLPRAATEDNGTRFLVTYSGFPAGARVFVPDFVAGSDALVPTSGGDLGLPRQIGQYVPGSGTLLLARVLGADVNGAGGQLVQLPANNSLNGATEVPLNGGSGYAVYEVVDSNPTLQETAQFPTFIGLGSVSAATSASESVKLAPVSTVQTASSTAPITRFGSLPVTSDCPILGDCGAQYFPQVSAPATPIQLTAVAGGDMTSHNGYIPVNNSGGGLLNWTATANYTSGTAWLTLSPSSGQNHTSIIVVANAKDLAAGTYQATIAINGGAAGTVNVPVTLTVTPAPTPTPAPTQPTTPATPAPVPTPSVVVSEVVNAATFDSTPLVAGSLGTVMGSHLTGKIVSVTFDGLPATLLYISDSQINLQVPAAVASKSAATMVVTVDGVASPPRQVTLSPAWPSLFAGGVLNQDNTVNSDAAAAAPGSVLQIFATGIPRDATVSARIGGYDQLVPLYAGDAPTLTGVQQVNVAVPQELPSGRTQLVICATSSERQFCSAGLALNVK